MLQIEVTPGQQSRIRRALARRLEELVGEYRALLNTYRVVGGNTDLLLTTARRFAAVIDEPATGSGKPATREE